MMRPSINVGDRIAVKTQNIMERIGVRENEVDSPLVVENFRVCFHVHLFITQNL